MPLETLEQRLGQIPNQEQSTVKLREAFSQPAFKNKIYTGQKYVLTDMIADFIRQKNPNLAQNDDGRKLYNAINWAVYMPVLYGIRRAGNLMPGEVMGKLTFWENVYLLAGLNAINNDFNGKINYPLSVEKATMHELVSYALRAGMDSMKTVHYRRRKNEKYDSHIYLPEEKRIRRETMHIDEIKNNVEERSNLQTIPVDEDDGLDFNARTGILKNISKLTEAYRLGKLDMASNIRTELDEKINPLPLNHYLRREYQRAITLANQNNQIELF